LLKVLVLSEYWYPQGGGAEIATFLYVRKMLEAGLEVTVLSNKDAYPGVDSDNLSLQTLPFGAKRVSKLSLMLKSSSIREKVIGLVKAYDIVYITGKLLFVTPDLKRASKDARIIAHLHDSRALLKLMS